MYFFLCYWLLVLGLYLCGCGRESTKVEMIKTFLKGRINSTLWEKDS
jgi:hypothetical protein